MAFTLVQHINSGVYQAADAAGKLSQAFAATVTPGNNVKVWVQWSSAVAADFSNVTDDKGNSYAISDKILGPSDNASVGAAHAENLTNSPKTITITVDVNDPFVAILLEEWSGEDTSGAALNAHGGQRQTSPGTGTDAVTSGNITTNVNGCNILGTSGSGDAGNPISVGTGYTLSDAGGSNINQISEHKTQATQGAVAATFTDGAAAAETLTIALAFKPAAAATSKLKRNSGLDGLSSSGGFFADPMALLAA